MSLMDMLHWVFYKAALLLDMKFGSSYDHDHFLCIFIDAELSELYGFNACSKSPCDGEVPDHVSPRGSKPR